MSYCRFSSCDFACDLYVYEGEGFHVHVAGGRWLGDIPKTAGLWPKEGPVDAESLRPWFAAHNAQTEFLKTATLEPIGHPLAGTSHDFATREYLLEFLVKMAKDGFRMPDHLVSRIEREIAEEAAAEFGTSSNPGNL
jgi:hypothetical protein